MALALLQVSAGIGMLICTFKTATIDLQAFVFQPKLQNRESIAIGISSDTDSFALAGK